MRGPSRGSEGGAETQRVRSFPLHKTDTSAMALKFVVSLQFFLVFLNVSLLVLEKVPSEGS